MANRNVDVELVYGVSGGGKLSGESGKQIKADLQALVDNLASKKIPTIKLFFDKADLDKKIKEVKQKLQTAFGKGIGTNINVTTQTSKGKTGSNTSKTTQEVTEQEKTYQALKKQINEAYKAQESFYKAKYTNSELYKKMSEEESERVLDFSDKIREANITEEQRSSLLEQGHTLQMRNEALLQSQLQKSEVSYNKVIRQMDDWIQGNKELVSNNKDALALVKQMEDAIKASKTDIKEGMTDTEKMEVYKKQQAELLALFQRNTGAISQMGATVETTGQKLKRAFDNKFVSMLGAALITLAARALKQVYDNVVKLDNAVTDLQIATGGTREETEELIKTYAKLAKEIGATTLEVASAADTWLRQGYSIEETNELIKDTIMLSKLGQLSSEEAAKALTSAMKGYKKEVSEALEIVDKFTAVDMKAAIGAGDIATAMAETAASAEVAGVSMDKLIGYIATVGEVTQDGAESVGTFFKTLFARMGSIEAGTFVDSETGESLNDVEKVVNKIGISLRNENGEFRDFSQVLDEVAQKWDTLDSVSQHALATAFSGTRQQEKFIVLMENYGAALDYAAVAADSAGTAQEKYQEAYMDSIEAKLNKLTATWQSFSSNLLDSDIVKFGVDFLSSIASLLDKIVQFGDGILIIVPAITIALVALHTILVKIKTTQTFMTMWTGLKSILAIFPAILASMKAILLNIKAQILAHHGATGALAAQTAATHAQTAANTAMNATNPVGWLILAAVAIYALIKALKSYKTATQRAKEASEEAAEQAQESLEQYEEAKEQTKEIIDLVNEYSDAVEGIDDASLFSAETRQKVLEIQQKITSEVGREADGLDLVNDSLDTSLKKLKQLKASTAKTEYEAALGAYTSAQYSAQKAYETSYVDIGGLGKSLIDDLYQMSFERGKDASKYADEIASLMREVGFSVSADATIGDKFYGVNLNTSNAQDAVNKLNKLLDEMISRNYASGSQDIYNQILDLRNSYQSYLDKQSSTLDGLVSSTVNMKAWEIDADGINIETLADYDAFRDKIIEAVKENQYIQDSAATSKDIIDSVDNWLSLYYADWFNKKVSQYKPQTTYLKSFLDILSELEEEYDALADAIEEMDEQGVLSADTITKLNEECPELIDYLEEIGALIQDGDGYKLAADSLDSYLQHVRDEYAATVEEMAAKYESIKAAFDSGEEGVTQENVDDAQTSLENALANRERLEAVINTLERSSLLDKFNEKLEAQSDALEEQADRYKDIVDIRKELLETYQDEIDYQKTLAEKTKSVADLQTRLAVSRLDTSASGRAATRELESELAEAQEDLAEFNLDHAIEKLTTQLSEEYDEYKSFIDEQISAIEDAIDNAASMTSDALRKALEDGIPYEKHHTGGFVGGSATLQSNEEFAKLLKGELVVTPKQMSNFMGKTLPALEGGSGTSVVYQAPLITIQCENVNKDTLPELQKVVDKAVKKVKEEIDGVISRTGKKGNINKFNI